MNTNAEKNTNSSPLSIEIAKAIAYVYADYPRLQKAKLCLELSFWEDHDNIFVSIYSKAESRSSNPEEIVVASGQGNKCGPHFSYIFDKDGSYISKAGIR